MTRLPLTFAGGAYDRTAALEEATVRPAGIDLTFVRLPVEETFFRMLRHREFDAAEMSLSSYVVSMSEDPPPFVGLPVFTSRAFRHSSVYVNRSAGIESAADLRGRRVGTPEYQLTASVWIRGILAEHHGLPVGSVRYLTGGLERPGRIEKAPIDLPEGIHVEPAGDGRTLSRMLAEGEVDALYSPRIPSPFAAGDPRVGRLFEDPIDAERRYFAATGIFPIMHLVVVRRDVHEAHPWVAQSLYAAFERSREIALDRLYDTSALPVMLPWLPRQLEEVRELLGDDFWSYGLEGNREVLERFLAYHHEQGLSPHRFDPEELFVSQATESAVI